VLVGYRNFENEVNAVNALKVSEPPEKMLSKVDIFSGLPVEELRDLARRCQWREYRANQLIIEYDEESRHVFFVMRGRARAMRFSASGREVAFQDLAAGQLFGDFSAIDGHLRSASVVAVTDSLITSVSASRFRGILKQYDSVNSAMLKRLVEMARMLSDRVFEFSTLAVRNRIHAELLRLANQSIQKNNVASICPAPTHTDIANRISTNREAVTRELNNLARGGVIEKRRGMLIVRDLKALATIVREANPDI
jgi:CRP/FNR family cyclic AMP-dependent transcriptional regulator